MGYYQIIADNFQSTIETIAMSADELATTIESGSQLMARALWLNAKSSPAATALTPRWLSCLPAIC
jgi:hypothetical protein